MKYSLYVDNFRGFRDTSIPITDVNFLVGENSTGKSSILTLLKMFSGPGFLMGRDFDDEVGFRHFSDMVSAHSQDQSYFHIGFAAEYKRKSENIVTGCLFTFREKQGQPRLFKCTFYRANEKITLRFGNSTYFKTSECQARTTVDEIISVLRSEWIGEHSGSKDTGYEKLDPRSSFGNRIPILIALSLVTNLSKSKKKKGGEPFLYPPEIGFSPPELTWFGPIRTEPKRTYDELTLDYSSQGQHTPYLIRRMLKSKTQAVKLKAFIERVGNASGLFQEVKTQSFGRG